MSRISIDHGLCRYFISFLELLCKLPSLKGGRGDNEIYLIKMSSFFCHSIFNYAFFASRYFGVESTHCQYVMKMHWIHSIFCWLLYECSFSIFHCMTRLDMIPYTIEGSRSLASTPLWCFSFYSDDNLIFRKVEKWFLQNWVFAFHVTSARRT